jgi:hypothetical protein
MSEVAAQATSPRSQAAGGLPARALTAAATAVLMLVAGWVAVTGVREIRSDFTAGAARFASQRWAEGVSAPASRSQWEAAVAELQAAVEIDPSDPALREALGNGWMVGTAQAWASDQDKASWAQRATESFRQATVIRPADPLAWALLASAMARSGDTGPAMHAAAERAIELGPHEGYVHEALIALVFEFWDQSSPAMQQWAGSLFENGTQAQRDAINRVGERFGTALESEVAPRDPARSKKQGGS